VDLFEEVGTGVESLGAAGAHRDLRPPKDIKVFTFGVKSNVRVKVNATLHLVGPSYSD
jgi:hypothetical protein